METKKKYSEMNINEKINFRAKRVSQRKFTNQVLEVGLGILEFIFACEKVKLNKNVYTTLK